MIRDPTLLSAPWVNHWFPGVTMEQLVRGYWSMALYIAMYDFAKGE